MVGAGVSGLKAAYDLQEKHGIEVLVTEARDAVGGNIRTRCDACAGRRLNTACQLSRKAYLDTTPQEGHGLGSSLVPLGNVSSLSGTAALNPEL